MEWKKKLQACGFVLAGIIVLAIAAPVLLYIAIAALAVFGIAVVLAVKSGLSGKKAAKLRAAELLRQAEGAAREDALVRREASHLNAVAWEQERQQAERRSSR